MLLLAIGYVALIRAFPPERLAALLADEVQAATGREFRIGGGLSFQLWPTIAVVAEQVTLGNAPWGTRKEMATVKRAAFEVAVSPLLRGQLHVLRVAVDGADVLLETDKQGRPNWIFAKSAKPAEPTPPAGESTAPPSVSLDRLQVSDARIALHAGLTQVTHTLDIQSLEIVNQGDQRCVVGPLRGPAPAVEARRQDRALRSPDARPGRLAVRGASSRPTAPRLAANGSLDSAGTVRATLTARIDKARGAGVAAGGCGRAADAHRGERQRAAQCRRGHGRRGAPVDRRPVAARQGDGAHRSACAAHRAGR